ncbi:hypothetical protein SRABI128_02033 [Microbacterium sp. Bi128]|nr:hypothetical protein SRABI128_02033 [Microbacterium sp. Bi128]
MYVIMGPTSLPSSALGKKPAGMKSAVMKPQAMKAPMLGMIIPDRNVPNFWTCTRMLVRGFATVSVAM